MKTVIERLVAMRDELNVIINQLGTEKEVTSTPEEPLENLIFNPKLFNTLEKLEQLKRTIGSFICKNPTKDERKIDAEKKNQYFYLYAALWSSPDVLADDSMVNYVRQMAIWFPECFPSEKEEQRKYELSLSHEKKKWEREKELLKVKEWKTFIKQSSMNVKKATRFEAITMQIYTAINLVVKDIRSKKH